MWWMSRRPLLEDRARPPVLALHGNVLSTVCLRQVDQEKNPDLTASPDSIQTATHMTLHTMLFI